VTTITAVVQKIVVEGPHGPYVVATSDDTVVVLSDLRKKRAGWRAMSGRFFRPSDQASSKGEPEMRKATLTEQKIAEAERLGIDLSRPAILTAFANGDIEDAIAMSKPGGIVAGEAAGAAAMRANKRLPKSGLLEHREALEQIGFVFGDEVDEVLVAATLPEGWGLVGNNPHDARHMALYDEQGRQRGHVFIKTTYYDYTGYMSWNSRYSVNVIVEDGRDKYDLVDDEEAPLVGVVMDGSTEIHRTEPQTATQRDYNASKQLSEKARQWLLEKYPQTDKPFAHWDD